MPQSSVDLAVAQNLRDTLKSCGRSAYAVATALGHSPTWLYRVLNGESGILLPTLREVASELGVTVSSLVSSPEELDSGDQNLLRVAKVAAVPGSGASRYDEEFKGWLPFPSELLNDPSVNPAFCNWVRIQGKLMEPTLPDGCLILVDRLSRGLQDGGTYVMETQEGLLVRRVRRNEELEGWSILSDNWNWPQVPFTRDINVIGQVRRAWVEL